MTEDDRAVMERLAVLEAEVKADAEAQRARKETALAKLREQRAQPAPDKGAPRSTDELGDVLALAKRAHGVKQDLSRPPKAGDKSWLASGGASLLLGPVGWLYAGSLREAVPASAAWVAFAALASKFVPLFLLLPVLLVAMPLSAIAGVVYALQYNRAGSRQRLFDREKPKQLPGE